MGWKHHRNITTHTTLHLHRPLALSRSLSLSTLISSCRYATAGQSKSSVQSKKEKTQTFCFEQNAPLTLAQTPIHSHSTYVFHLAASDA